jgi:hypothetical protein
MDTLLVCESCLTEYRVPAGPKDWPPCDACGGGEFRVVQEDLGDRLVPTLGDPPTVQPLLKGIPRVVEKAEKSKKKIAKRREVYALVNRRDKWHCRACGRPVDVHGVEMMNKGHHHHLAYRSQGGRDETANIVLVCAFCHAAIHARELGITGNADSTLMCTGKVKGREGRWESAP